MVNFESVRLASLAANVVFARDLFGDWNTESCFDLSSPYLSPMINFLKVDVGTVLAVMEMIIRLPNSQFLILIEIQIKP